MKTPRIAALAASLAAGCLATARPVVPGPLDREGEVYLEVEPPRPEGGRLAFRIASIAAVRDDFVETPLVLARTSVSREELSAPRLLAWGRLEPGSYSGFSIQIAKATRAGEGGRADLLVPAGPARAGGPFTVTPRRATVLRLEVVGTADSIEKDFAVAPSFVVKVPRSPLPQLSVWCSNGERHDVTVSDRREHSLSAALPTGRSPWGLAYDPVRDRLYVALEGEDEVQVFDATALGEAGRVRLQPADAPRELALTPDRRLLLVANGGSNSVSFVDPVSLMEVARAPVGEVPTSVLIDRAGNRAYVFNSRSSFISVIDIANRAPAGTIATEYGPLRGQLSRDGSKLYVLAANSSYLTVFGVPGAAQAGRVYVGLGTTAIKVDPGTDLLYVAQGGAGRLAVFEPFSLLPVDFIEVPGDASYLAIDGGENALYALLPDRRSAVVVDLASKRKLGEIDVGSGPRVLAIFGERD